VFPQKINEQTLTLLTIYSKSSY